MYNRKEVFFSFQKAVVARVGLFTPNGLSGLGCRAPASSGLSAALMSATLINDILILVGTGAVLIFFLVRGARENYGAFALSPGVLYSRQFFLAACPQNGEWLCGARFLYSWSVASAAPRAVRD